MKFSISDTFSFRIAKFFKNMAFFSVLTRFSISSKYFFNISFSFINSLFFKNFSASLMLSFCISTLTFSSALQDTFVTKPNWLSILGFKAKQILKFSSFFSFSSVFSASVPQEKINKNKKATKNIFFIFFPFNNIFD